MAAFLENLSHLTRDGESHRGRQMLMHAITGSMHAGCGVVIAMSGRRPRIGKTYMLCTMAAAALMSGRNVMLMSIGLRSTLKAIERVRDQLPPLALGASSHDFESFSYYVAESKFCAYTMNYALTNLEQISEEARALDALVLVDDVVIYKAIQVVNGLAGIAARGQCALCAITAFTKIDGAPLMPDCHLVDWQSLVGERA